MACHRSCSKLEAELGTEPRSPWIQGPVEWSSAEGGVWASLPGWGFDRCRVRVERKGILGQGYHMSKGPEVEKPASVCRLGSLGVAERRCM